MKRVVVTGAGGISALGDSWEAIERGLRRGRNAVRYMTEWDKYADLNTRLAAPCDAFQAPAEWTRKQLRSMGRVSQLAVRASQLALEQAGLDDPEFLRGGEVGVACGSCVGSTPDVADFASMLIDYDGTRVNANTYVRMMPHTAAANVSILLGLTGRVIPTSSACTSGSQAIGFAYETIRSGAQQVMVAGGSEELCPTQAKAFDVLYAASRRNEDPQSAPRPYDRDRDGLVIGEGAAMLVLEEYEHARRRGAQMLAEIVGFATNCDGTHVTRPDERTMRVVMERALQSAQVSPGDIGYVNGHGTATAQGDVAESRATAALFGPRIPISSQKSYLGHTLGACGALEAWFSIEMMNGGWFAPTINLENLDPDCAPLDYLRGDGREIRTDLVMSNNFAFGGVNTSLIFGRIT
jgi:3-oxoacyl-[acyl-carrier-protein] synthase II